MNAPGTARGTGAEGWLGVSDGLLRGINHALSNRVAAVGAVARILERGDTGGEPLMRALLGEVEQMERVIRLLQLLPRERDGGAPEPVHVPDLLGDVVMLHQLQSALRDVTCEVAAGADTAPVWIEPVLLTHALLMLLNDAARVVQLAGSGRLLVHCDSDAAWTRVTVEAHTAAPVAAGAGAPTDSLATVEPETVAMLLRSSGGELVVEERNPAGGTERWQLRLPTLAEVRRREAAG